MPSFIEPKDSPKNEAQRCFCFPTHLPITLNICLFDGFGETGMEHQARFEVRVLRIPPSFHAVDGGVGLGSINCCVEDFALGAPIIKCFSFLGHAGLERSRDSARTAYLP